MKCFYLTLNMRCIMSSQLVLCIVAFTSPVVQTAAKNHTDTDIALLSSNKGLYPINGKEKCQHSYPEDIYHCLAR